MKIIAVSNHKGGVGKSTTCHALGDALALKGHKVLLLDLDPQSTLTNATGLRDADPNLAHVFKDNLPITQCIYDVANHDGVLHLAAGDITMSLVEKNLPAQLDGYHILKSALTAVQKVYDVCLIDCPPSLSALVYNALIAADGVIIPTMPQINDLRGLNLFLDTVIEIQSKSHLNPKLEILGVLATFYDGRLLTHQEALMILQNNYHVFATQISRSIRVAESPAAGESVITYDPENKTVKQYQKFADEVNQWLVSG